MGRTFHDPPGERFFGTSRDRSLGPLGAILSRCCDRRLSDDFPETLSYESGDDRIVHSVRKYKERHPDTAVAVCTEDTGMSLRCEAHGIDVVEPDIKLRLDNPQDELTKRLKQTTSELHELKFRVPILTVIASQAGAPCTTKGPISCEVTGSFKERNLDAEFASYRKTNQLHPRSTTESSHLRGVESLVNNMVDNYNQFLTDHLNQYRAWLEHSYRLDKFEAFRIEFRLWLQNTGNAPADDIDVTIDVGDSVFMLYLARSEQVKALVRRPPPDRSAEAQAAMRVIQMNPVVHKLDSVARQFARPETCTSVQSAVDGGSHQIRYHSKRLKHQEWQQIGDLVAIVCPDKVGPFEMSYRITAANLAKAVEGTIPFIVRLR